MNLNEIQDLIKFVSKSGVTEVEIEKKDFKIVIRAKAAIVQAAGPVVTQVAAPAQQMIAAAPVTAAPQAEAPVAPAAGGDDSKYVTIKSPMIGTFYRSPGPEKPVFVNVGDTIKAGDKICIIEAMKLFNEIEAEISGKIVKVLMDDAKPVEYDQPLFLVEPA
ncbi:MAG TPA: acetyl-CoA carboxylase biotin carboxyl carrier protein [Flavobacteriales bacterium]|nr:acetyl-CoA carboxylase biotin carboxyl carrier protein [Flavobacteriales bacterium]HCA82946.1 acetyl-CoA carboxylase biotin carboxyl carrier protein [Flavobacteriales bacterium]HRE73855.1 acetyl-CoA carboxylase biotin carboxyl carrier protein [Flavobacteriales bacterium]HRJ35402.1 acetyl-CoA carboxylase biotin carboxyl carrier protein [Flavobacteriales bacterium]HRJ39749.1 acetyl-CoA carboxylase biotin carboxyl carrier protein [Flavobacteriales bacterium]